MNNTYNKITLFLGCFLVLISLLLTGCGSGASDSDSSENAISADDAAVLVGVYQGSEAVRLIRSVDKAVVDNNNNEVSVSVNRSGQLSLSSSGGNQGQAQITQGKTFRLRADARTQFNGACSAGTIIIHGSISPQLVTASYSSEGLVCNSQEFYVEGELSAQRQ